MTATAAVPLPSPSSGSAAGADRRPGLGRLTAVELRKMTDTRSGFWLPIGIAAVELVTVLISVLVHHGHDATFRHVFDNSIQPASFLLPVMGILLVCGEFSQRTTLSTFTLVPDRGRVLEAKLAAAVVAALCAFVVCLAFSALFSYALGAPAGGVGGIPGAVLAQAALYLSLTMLMGIAFGAAILISAPAIVANLLIPTVWAALASSIGALATLDRWLDIGTTLSPLSQHPFSGTQWAHALTTVALWMLVPLLVGWVRFRRGDIN